MEPVAAIIFVGMPRRVPSMPAAPGVKAMIAGLSEVIKQSGLKKPTIAEAAGISRQYLYGVLAGKENPTLTTIAAIFHAAGYPLDRWLEDRALYGRDKNLHDRIQKILNNKGQKAVALRVIVGDEE